MGESVMNDQERVCLAFDIIEATDIMHEFEDFYVAHVPKDLWDKFCNDEEK